MTFHQSPVFVLSVCAFLVGCGTRTALNITASDAGCVLPRYAQDAAFRVESCPGSCTLSGRSTRGESLVFTCDGGSCVFRVNGVPQCPCTALDFANTCPNGIPLCLQRSDFDFARSDYQSCADR